MYPHMSRNIGSAIEAVRKRHKEREGVISEMFLSLISGKSMVFIGPEGSGKEALVSDVCGAAGIMPESYIISRSTAKEEIQAKGGVMVLGDVFKANSAAINRIADMISDGNTVFGSSEDVPSETDDAVSLYDIFLFRSFLEPMRSDDAFLSAVSGKKEFPVSVKIPHTEIEKARDAADNVSVDDEALAAILTLRDIFKDAGKYVSDRRWKDMLYVLRTAAAAAGEKSAGMSYIPLLQHMMWDWPEEIGEVRRAVFSVCTPGGPELNGLYAESEELLKLAVESKGMVDENAGFPRIIYCYDCNSSFPSLKRLREHHAFRPKHTYADPHTAKDAASSDYIRYTYEELVTLLTSKYEWPLFRKSEEEDRMEFLAETKALRERKTALEDNYDKDRAKLSENIEKNFWLTDRDRKDIMSVFDLRSAELADIESLIADVEFILE